MFTTSPTRYQTIRTGKAARTLDNPRPFVLQFARRTGLDARPADQVLFDKRRMACRIVGSVDGFVGRSHIVEFRIVDDPDKKLSDQERLSVQAYMWLTRRSSAYVVKIRESEEHLPPMVCGMTWEEIHRDPAVDFTEVEICEF